MAVFKLQKKSDYFPHMWHGTDFWQQSEQQKAA